jgi:hypothetical protein
MRLEHASTLKGVLERNELEKTAIRGQYERLIGSMGAEYQAQN